MKILNNDIYQSYCTPELIKLLEEKGCTITETIITDFIEPKDSSGGSTEVKGISQALAIEWIRVNFGIWITFRRGGLDPLWYDFFITNSDNIMYYEEDDKSYKTPQEATEAALSFVLTKLI